MRFKIRKRFIFFDKVRNDSREDGVFENIGMIAGVEGVAVTEHWKSVLYGRIKDKGFLIVLLYNMPAIKAVLSLFCSPAVPAAGGRSMRKYGIFTVILFCLASIIFISCPSSSSGGVDDDDEGGGTPGTNPGGTIGPIVGYDLTLQTGSYWTFWWDWSDKATWTSSYDSGTDNDVGTGYLTITLGAPATVAGKPVFAVILSGDIPEPWQTNPFWHWIGSDSSGLYASSDGYSIKYIVNAATSRVSSGFFRRWVDLTDTAAPILSSGSYTATQPMGWSTSVQSAEWGSSYDDSIYVPGYDPIAGDEYNRSASEKFKAGIGPVACSDYDYLYDRESSSDSSTYITKWAFSLVKTNLVADDSFTLPELVWDLAEMPDTRTDPSVVFLDGNLYILLGGVTYEGSRTMYRQEADGSWTQRADLPSSFSGLYGFGTACVYDGKIYAFITAKPSYRTAVYAYDPGTNSWSTAYAPGTLNVSPATSVLNGTVIFFLGENSSRHEFDPSAGTITSYSIINSRISHPRIISGEGKFYIVCQFNPSGDTYTTGLWTCPPGGWTQQGWYIDGKRRAKPALAIYDGRLWVFGGDKSVVSAPLSAGVVGTWKTHTDMLYGGAYLSAVVVGNEIRVYGSNAGTAIEIYHPDSDN